MPKVFVSYRRADSEAETGRLYEYLSRAFGAHSIFRDIDTIAPGEAFSSKLTLSIIESQVILAVIGPTWTTVREADGHQRLSKETDYVRQELEQAHAAAKFIIPVLLGDTPIPRTEELPDSLSFLSTLQVCRLRPDPDFRRDATRIIENIRTKVGAFPMRGAVAAITIIVLCCVGWNLLKPEEGVRRPVVPALPLPSLTDRTRGVSAHYLGLLISRKRDLRDEAQKQLDIGSRPSLLRAWEIETQGLREILYDLAMLYYPRDKFREQSVQAFYSERLELMRKHIPFGKAQAPGYRAEIALGNDPAIIDDLIVELVANILGEAEFTSWHEKWQDASKFKGGHP